MKRVSNRSPAPDTRRRQALKLGLGGLITALAGRSLFAFADETHSGLRDVGPLIGPDANGLMLPAGFSGRVIARTGKRPTSASDYIWHKAPDGAATFATDDGGWIYVCNSEMSRRRGGAGALRFDANGEIADAYRVLKKTSRNCSGGPTPWGTWLSCEEDPRGQVWECDPYGQREAVLRPSLGTFNHEAAAVDPATGQVYLTEDMGDGCFYRFTPNSVDRNGRADLSDGILEVARVEGADQGAVSWAPISEPSGKRTPTRYQVEGSATFRRGEGAWYGEGKVYFVTTGDNRVWVYDTAAESLAIIYDAARHPDPILTGVDNITVSASGDVLVAEDGGDMQIVAITADGTLVPIVQVLDQPRSEITGPAFDPSGTRLYFNSQWGKRASENGGITYEVRGPFQSA